MTIQKKQKTNSESKNIVRDHDDVIKLYACIFYHLSIDEVMQTLSGIDDPEALRNKIKTVIEFALMNMGYVTSKDGELEILCQNVYSLICPVKPNIFKGDKNDN